MSRSSFFFGALSAHFFEFVAEFLPIPRHPRRRPATFPSPAYSSFLILSRPNGRAAPWKSREPKNSPGKTARAQLSFFRFRVRGKRRGGAPRSRRTESIATMSLWVDKHRPRCLDQLRVHSKPARQLQKLLAGGDCPHLLFYGPSGAGKKTLCLATLREVGDLYLHPPLRPPPTRALTLDSFLFRSSSGRRWRSFARSRRLGRSRWVPFPASAPPALDAI